MSLPYYPLYVRDFHEGTLQMSLEQKGAYIMVLNLIYTRGGPIADEDGYIARYVGCSVRKWKQLRQELVAIGKIVAKDGVIRNSRADEELLKRASYQDQQRENASKPRKNRDVEKPSITTRAKPKPEPEPMFEEDAVASSPPPSAKPKPHFFPADWSLPDEWLRWALDYRTPQNQSLTEAEIRNEADSFSDYWRGRTDAKAKRAEWFGTFRARIREQAQTIIGRRLRAERDLRGSSYPARTIAAEREKSLSADWADVGNQACPDAWGGWDDRDGDGARVALRLVADRSGDRADPGGAEAPRPENDRRVAASLHGSLSEPDAGRRAGPQGGDGRLDFGHGDRLRQGVRGGADVLEAEFSEVPPDARAASGDHPGNRGAYARANGRLL